MKGRMYDTKVARRGRSGNLHQDLRFYTSVGGDERRQSQSEGGCHSYIRPRGLTTDTPEWSVWRCNVVRVYILVRWKRKHMFLCGCGLVVESIKNQSWCTSSIHTTTQDSNFATMLTKNEPMSCGVGMIGCMYQNQKIKVTLALSTRRGNSPLCHLTTSQFTSNVELNWHGIRPAGEFGWGPPWDTYS